MSWRGLAVCALTCALASFAARKGAAGEMTPERTHAAEALGEGTRADDARQREARREEARRHGRRGAQPSPGRHTPGRRTRR